MRYLRWALGSLLCAVGLVLPYRLRVLYGNALAALFHAPYILFGRTARLLLDRLGMRPPHEPC